MALRASTMVTLGVGATVAVMLAGLVQAANENPAVHAALTVSVPDKYKALVEGAGHTCSEISPNILAALLTQESGFQNQTSPAGAQGVAQFMPSTWESSGIDGNGDGKRDVWDPEDAIPSAAKYLCAMAKETKDVPGDKQSNMLAAYNAGSGAVRSAHGVPAFKETQDYVRSINALAGKAPSGGRMTSRQQAVAAINSAQTQIGKPYSWGGGDATGPSTGTCCSPNGSSGIYIVGFDCSGLTLYAYAQAGIFLPRTAAEQYAASEPVSRDAMLPGDLVFYGSSAGSIHHVGLYIGGGYMIEAPRPGTNVRYSSINSMSDLFGVARPVSQQKKEI
ncbi:bifunctional lytic transglycosylase/C40 family peptidase [Streptomyces xanthochromogenes]|uniref:C40 family peptidase n=1 Tax=Streptomyces xanthochromogenes TaxID=67384 RepID=UPI0034131F6E